jgi:hypothetical protein
MKEAARCKRDDRRGKESNDAACEMRKRGKRRVA